MHVVYVRTLSIPFAECALCACIWPVCSAFPYGIRCRTLFQMEYMSPLHSYPHCVDIVPSFFRVMTNKNVLHIQQNHFDRMHTTKRDGITQFFCVGSNSNWILVPSVECSSKFSVYLSLFAVEHYWCMHE